MLLLFFHLAIMGRSSSSRKGCHGVVLQRRVSCWCNSLALALTPVGSSFAKIPLKCVRRCVLHSGSSTILASQLLCGLRWTLSSRYDAHDLSPACLTRLHCHSLCSSLRFRATFFHACLLVAPGPSC